LKGYGLNHRRNSVLFATARLKHLGRVLGDALLSDLTEERIKAYIRQRQHDRISGRTINMELGELSRAIGHTWRELWPKVKKLEERKDVGRALSPDEQRWLLDRLETSQSPRRRALIPVLLLTGMRSGEAMSLRWYQVDLISRVITVGWAKTSSGTGRLIPINDELAHVLAVHRAWFVNRFGEPNPDHCLFPWGSPDPSDPTRHITDVKRGWVTVRKQSGVSCRLHDLRHTFATGLAERGVPEATMLALMGHMSRAMLERYSHIRMAAKRSGVSGATLRPAEPISEAVPVKVPVPQREFAVQ
jgi:integrase